MLQTRIHSVLPSQVTCCPWLIKSLPKTLKVSSSVVSFEHEPHQPVWFLQKCIISHAVRTFVWNPEVHEVLKDQI